MSTEVRVQEAPPLLVVLEDVQWRPAVGGRHHAVDGRFRDALVRNPEARLTPAVSCGFPRCSQDLIMTVGAKFDTGCLVFDEGNAASTTDGLQVTSTIGCTAVVHEDPTGQHVTHPRRCGPFDTQPNSTDR